MLSKIKSRILPYLLPVAIIGGCLGTCSLIPKYEEPKVRAQVETTEIMGVPTRIYRDELKPGKEYIDFYPFENLDVVIEEWHGKKYTHEPLASRADQFYFNALEQDAKQRGLIE